MKPLKVKVSVSLDEDIVEQVKLLAEEDDRSFSQYVNMVLKNHLEQQNQMKA
jgi:metal-responsive CopG/Arc/MetJ family transcriptional regulator